MNYIVKEFQTTNHITQEVPHSLNDPSSQNEAESALHLILASAAISQVEVHTGVILTEDGRVVKQGCYRHPPVTPVESVPQGENN